MLFRSSSSLSSSSSFSCCGEGNGNGYYLSTASRLPSYLLLSTSLRRRDRVPRATRANRVTASVTGDGGASSAVTRGRTLERRFTVSDGGAGAVGVSCTAAAASVAAPPAIAEAVDVIDEVRVERREQQQQHARRTDDGQDDDDDKIWEERGRKRR